MKQFLISVVALSIGIGIGFYGGRTTAPRVEPAQTKQPVVLMPATKLEADKPSGEGMTPDQMFTYIDKMSPGVEFDMTYMNYLIKLRSTGSAMTRVARDKATNGELKAYAVGLYDTEQQYIAVLYNKQRGWGFTHH